MLMRRLSRSFCTFSSLTKARRAALPMITRSTLVKPPVSTFSVQSSRSSMGLAAVLPHCFVPSSLILLVKPKSITSFTPSPTTGMEPVMMACTAIHSSRRVVASFRVAYSSISFCAARCAGVMPL